MEEHEGADGEDGTAAVLYGIFTSFTESLAGLEERLVAIEAAVGYHLDRRADALEQHMASLEAALASIRSLLERHAEETSHSLGRRATDAGRRLATDLGLRPRRPHTGGDG